MACWKSRPARYDERTSGPDSTPAKPRASASSRSVTNSSGFTHRSAVAALDVALEVLERGEAFGVYPEGTRSRDGRLYRGRTGVAQLALVSGAPIVPVGLIGTERLQPVGTNVPRIVKVTVRFGPPIEVAGRYDGVAPGRARREIDRKSTQLQSRQYLVCRLL